MDNWPLFSAVPPPHRAPRCDRCFSLHRPDSPLSLIDQQRGPTSDHAERFTNVGGNNSGWNWMNHLERKKHTDDPRRDQAPPCIRMIGCKIISACICFIEETAKIYWSFNTEVSQYHRISGDKKKLVNDKTISPRWLPCDLDDSGAL